MNGSPQPHWLINGPLRFQQAYPVSHLRSDPYLNQGSQSSARSHNDRRQIALSMPYDPELAGEEERDPSSPFYNPVGCEWRPWRITAKEIEESESVLPVLGRWKIWSDYAASSSFSAILAARIAVRELAQGAEDENRVSFILLFYP